MTDAERMLLSDAIQTAIEAERKALKWRKLFYASGALCLASMVCAAILLVV